MTVHENLSQTTAENLIKVDDVVPITGAVVTSIGMVDTYVTIIGNFPDVKEGREGLASLKPDLDDPVSKAKYDYINEKLEPVTKIESTFDTIKKVLLNIAPVFLIFGWVDFFKSVRTLYQAENRHYELVMNVFVNFVSAAGLTIAFALVAAGVAGFVYAAPYVIASILGVAALRGLYYTAKHLYYAWNSTGAERWEHLKNAGKAFFNMAINTLGIVLNAFLIMSKPLVELATKIGGMISKNSVDILEILRTPVVAVALAWFSMIGAMLLASAVNITKQTWTMFQNWRKGVENTAPTFESEAMNDIEDIIKSSKKFWSAPFESAKDALLFFTAPINVPAYFSAALIYRLVVRPIAVMVVGVPYLLARVARILFPSKKAEIVLPTKDELDTKKKLLDGKAVKLALEFTNSIEKGSNNPEQVALLTNVRDNDVKKLKDSTDTSRTPVARIKEGMERYQISSCFQSFLHPGGNKVAVLARKAEALEQEFKEYETALSSPCV